VMVFSEAVPLEYATAWACMYVFVWGLLLVCVRACVYVVTRKKKV
jgi:hypothetical protein